MLLNISRSGCKVEAPDFRAEPGATILLDLTPALSVSGQIIWRERGAFGIEFHQEIDDQAIASLVPAGRAGDRGMTDRFGRQLPELNAWIRLRPR